MLFINEYRTFLASPIHFLLGLFMFIPPANMLTCTKTESNKLNQQFTLSEILQRMIYNLQYRPHEDPSWHLLPRIYNKNNVCGSGPQGPSQPPLSLYHSHKKSLPSLWWLSDFFRCTPTNIWLQAVRTACHAAIRPHFDSVSTPAEIFRNLPHSWPQTKHITQLRVKMKQCWDWFLDLLSEMCRVESHDLVLSQRWVTNLVTWYLIQQNRK